MLERIFWFLVCGLFLFLASAALSKDISVEQLAIIIKEMESAISDIQVEYEWRTIPPETAEEAEKEFGGEMLVDKDGLRRCKLYVARPVADANAAADANSPNLSPLNWHFISEDSETLVMKGGNSWPQITKQSYDGLINRRLSIGGWPEIAKEASISIRKPDNNFAVLSPIGFSVYYTSLNGVANYYLLSHILKRNPELVRLDTAVQKTGGFNTVHLDLLQQSLKKPVMRIYLSIDHNYTPVRYEHLSGGNVADAFEVHSLEKIGEKLWFPSSGAIMDNESGGRISAFQTTAPIVCNQKNSKSFELEFPSGTKVTDKIKGITYRVK
jgi:hypothetical protein